MWHVPADHSIFEKLSTEQWLWYYYNIAEDKKEEFEKRRDLIEYHASFIEPEAVRKIRESREKAVEVPDAQFSAGLKHFFGRSIGASKKTSGKIEAVDPTHAMATYKREKIFGKPKVNSGMNYKHWLNHDPE